MRADLRSLQGSPIDKSEAHITVLISVPQELSVDAELLPCFGATNQDSIRGSFGTVLPMKGGQICCAKSQLRFFRFPGDRPPPRASNTGGDGSALSSQQGPVHRRRSENGVCRQRPVWHRTPHHAWKRIDSRFAVRGTGRGTVVGHWTVGSGEEREMVASVPTRSNKDRRCLLPEHVKLFLVSVQAHAQS